MKKTRKLLSIILSICILFSITTGLDFSAYALSSSGSCGDNVAYTFNSSTGELVISGTGAMTDYGTSSSPFNANIKTVVINSGVTSIGGYTFCDCTSLTSITIPDSVTSIGEGAFAGCTSLTSITIPDSVTSISDYTFYDCTGLTSVTIGNSVTSIGDYAFYSCTGIKELTMPCSAKIYNSSYTFYDCSNIEKVTLTKGTGTMQNYTLGNRPAQNSKNPLIQYTPWYISGDCIKELIIEDGVANIGDYAFYKCTGLTSVTISDSVTSIGSDAFYWCTGLTSVTIPDSVTSIGDNAFYRCTGLTSVTISDSVTSIGSDAFYWCTGLTSVTIGNSVTSIGSHAFYNCAGLTSVTIPNSVTSIGEGAFRDCTGLTSVTIPNSVTRIGEYAFRDCTGLKDVYYMGTEDDWKNITIVAGNTSLTNATIRYHNDHEYITIDKFENFCTGDGYITYQCFCGEEYTEIIPASHKKGEIIQENRVEPNCTENGSYDEVTYCTLCGKEVSRVKIDYEILVDSSKYPESTHNYTNSMSTTYSFSYLGAKQLKITFSSSTATESGCDYIYLYDSNGSQIGKYDGTSLAGKTFTIDSDSFSIKLTSDSSVTKYGFSFNSIYAIIDTNLTAKGHSYVVDKLVEPDCLTDGLYVYECSACGDSYFEEPKALGHTNAPSVEENRVEPTCTENGSYNSVIYCTVCEAEISRTTVTLNKLDHKYVVDKLAEPDCTTDGLYIYECSACGNSYFEEPKALGHTIVVDKAIAPTCNKTGLTEGSHCSYCNKVFVAQEIIHATGHNYESRTTNPTCTVDGADVYTCKRCNDSYTVVLPAKGHNYELYRCTATCTKAGYNLYKCSVCNANTTEKVDSISHTCDEFNSIDNGNISYHCSACDSDYTKNIADVLAEWDYKSINRELDVVNDGVINAKDYAKLLHISKWGY